MKGWIAALAGALLLGALGGYRWCQLRCEAELAQRQAQQARQEAARLEAMQAQNRQLQETADTLYIQMRKEQERARQEYDTLLDRVRRGAVRVSIPVRAGDGLPEAGHSGDDTGKTRAELEPQTVEDLLAIGREGDTAIRELNQCIDQYRALARQLAGQD